MVYPPYRTTGCGAGLGVARIMKILLLCVGKMKPSPEMDLCEKYAKQLSWPVKIIEVEAKKNLPDAQRMEQEAELLLGAYRKSQASALIALDERGKEMSSPELAKQIGTWQTQGVSHLALIIGGADGLHESVRKEAKLTLAFGKLTWPHMLVRSMVMEQIYRAQSILAGHPYHRG